MRHDEVVVIFARYPVPGAAKTRLIPALGREGAACLHRRLAENAVALAREAGCQVVVCYTGAGRSAFRAWLGADLAYRRQSGEGLGRRLARAVGATFRRAARRVVVMGCDAPDLSPDILRQAFDALRTHDAVLGPAVDGGYYLIGLTQSHPSVFEGVAWGTARVAQQTRQAIATAGLSLTELPTLADVDTPDDLPDLRPDARFADVFTGSPLLSVIVPTLNAAGTLHATLARAREAANIEIIVADGGSEDATHEIAAEFQAKWLQVKDGRAAQLNQAALVAQGRRLLFLHADTLVPPGYDAALHAALDDPATVAGAFRFETDGRGLGMRLVEWGVNVRSRLRQWPYGDQGLFMERRVFNEIGGFAALPIMEDFELVRRLRRRGRVVTLPKSMVTSARRWRQKGVVRTTLTNQLMVAGFFCGVSVDRLRRFYRAGRGPRA